MSETPPVPTVQLWVDRLDAEGKPVPMKVAQRGGLPWRWHDKLKGKATRGRLVLVEGRTRIAAEMTSLTWLEARDMGVEGIMKLSKKSKDHAAKLMAAFDAVTEVKTDD